MDHIWLPLAMMAAVATAALVMLKAAGRTEDGKVDIAAIASWVIKMRGAEQGWVASRKVLERTNEKLPAEIKRAMGYSYPEQLLQLAGDEKAPAEVRARAVDCLHGEAISNDDAVDLLGKLALPPYPNVLRAQAAQALGLVNEQAALRAGEHLLPVLPDESGRIQREAARSLARLRAMNERVRLEEGLLPLLQDDTASVRRMAAVLMGQHGTQAAAAEGVAQAVANADEDLAVHLHAALLRFGVPGSEEQLLPFVGHEKARTNRAACKALARFGSPSSVERLLALGDREPLALEAARAIRERFGEHSMGGLSLVAPVQSEGGLSEWSDPEGLLSLDEDEIAPVVVEIEDEASAEEEVPA